MSTSPRPLTDQQLTNAREMYEGGDLQLTEIAQRCGTHYMCLIGLAAKLGWARKSSVPEINQARRLATEGLHRRALEYLCGLIPTGRTRLDEEIIAETRRISRTLQRRATDSARAAVRE